MLPVLANTFGVTIDELMGFKLAAYTNKEKFIRLMADAGVLKLGKFNIKGKESGFYLDTERLSTNLHLAKLGESFARQLSRRAGEKLPFLPSEGLEEIYVNTLGKLVDRELEKSLPEIIQQYVSREAGTFLGSPLSVTLHKHEQELPRLKTSLMGLIHTAVVGALPQLLGSGEIKRLVVKRINSLDPKELNALLKRLMKKELAAIEWLGALLGSLLGAVTYFAGKLF
jgi:uncharacterized membrane protein YheB (UPF0754 family)